MRQSLLQAKIQDVAELLQVAHYWLLQDKQLFPLKYFPGLQEVQTVPGF